MKCTKCTKRDAQEHKRGGERLEQCHELLTRFLVHVVDQQPQVIAHAGKPKHHVNVYTGRLYYRRRSGANAQLEPKIACLTSGRLTSCLLPAMCPGQPEQGGQGPVIRRAGREQTL